MIRVLIADDHKVVRQGLRFLLSSEPGIEVAGEAADGGAALDAIRALTARRRAARPAHAPPRRPRRARRDAARKG